MERKSEQDRIARGYILSGWAAGPDTVCGFLWAAALFYVAASDETCKTYEGHTSGADGQFCTYRSDWDQTKWDAAGGSSCWVTGEGFLIDDGYSQDAALDGGACGVALTAYRAAMAGGFTCNCTGAYSSLPSGMRTEPIAVYMSTAGQMIAALLGPLVGSYFDYNKRKGPWKKLLVATVFGMVLMGVVGKGSVWVVAVIAGAFVVVTSELVVIPRASYLDQVGEGDDDQTKTIVSGKRIFASYASQLIFAILCLGISMGVGSGYSGNQLSAITTAELCAVWYGLNYYWCLQYFPDPEPLHSKPEGNGCMSAFREIWATMKDMWKTNPEAVKYLGALFFALNGAATTVITIMSVYLPDQLHFSAFQSQAFSAILLLAGLPATWLFTVAAARFSFKQMWVIICGMWLVIDILVPLVAVTPVSESIGSFYLVLGLGVLGSFGLTWFYAIYWPALLSMTPDHEVSRYLGLFTFTAKVASIVEPLIYSLVVQQTNNPRLGFATTIPWCILAMIAFTMVDFEKGKAAKAAGNKATAGDKPGALEA